MPGSGGNAVKDQDGTSDKDSKPSPHTKKRGPPQSTNAARNRHFHSNVFGQAMTWHLVAFSPALRFISLKLLLFLQLVVNLTIPGLTVL